MIQAFQFNNLPVAIALWVIVYSCDYYLTLYGNQLRSKYASAHQDIKESYELNPFFQRDIDTNNRVSGRFIFMLVLFSIWLAVIWYAAQVLEIPELFSVAAGFVLLLEVPVLALHANNVFLYRLLSNPGAANGYISYARWVSLTLVARISGYWLLVYVALFLLTGNWLFVGGALAMLRLFISYSSRGQRLRDRSPAIEAPTDAQPVDAAVTGNR